MVKLEDAVIARYESAGHKFEVLVDPDLASDIKEGKKVQLNDLLAAESVYKDSKKGDVASEQTVMEVFGSDNLEEIVKKIIKQGEVQLTTEQRKKMKEKKHKEIVNYITRNAFNPKNSMPHPPQRIETAMEEAGINIDSMKTVSEQIPEIVKNLKRLLPISMEKLKIAIKVSAADSGKVSGILHQNFGTHKEEWQSDGSLIALLEIPAGLKNDLFDKVNKACAEEPSIKILEK